MTKHCRQAAHGQQAVEPLDGVHVLQVAPVPERHAGVVEVVPPLQEEVRGPDVGRQHPPLSEGRRPPDLRGPRPVCRPQAMVPIIYKIITKNAKNTKINQLKKACDGLITTMKSMNSSYVCLRWEVPQKSNAA